MSSVKGLYLFTSLQFRNSDVCGLRLTYLTPSFNAVVIKLIASLIQLELECHCSQWRPGAIAVMQPSSGPSPFPACWQNKGYGQKFLMLLNKTLPRFVVAVPILCLQESLPNNNLHNSSLDKVHDVIKRPRPLQILPKDLPRNP